MRTAPEADKRPIRSVEVPISLTAVKLIFPLTDPETGATRDVIVREIENGNIFHDRYTGTKSWTRYIAGLGIMIPWPKREPKEHKDYDCDTLRIDVESKTFVPTLLKPPMPTSVIDELRNKYSVFRTRHDEEYIQKKMQESEEEEALKKSVSTMRSPIHEVNKRDRKLRKALGKGQLTEEMLAKIGEVMARNKEAGRGSDVPLSLAV
jgi:large subunit ribosomal protein L24